MVADRVPQTVSIIDGWIGAYGVKWLVELSSDERHEVTDVQPPGSSAEGGGSFRVHTL